MKNITTQLTQLRAMNYTLQTLHQNNTEMEPLFKRYAELLAEIESVWTECFNEVADAKCNVDIAVRKITNLEEQIIRMKSEKSKELENYDKICEIVGLHEGY